jgi:hypothetical protein
MPSGSVPAATALIRAWLFPPSAAAATHELQDRQNRSIRYNEMVQQNHEPGQWGQQCQRQMRKHS